MSSSSEQARTPADKPGWIYEVRWSSDGLVPAVVQDVSSGRVLMLAYMNSIALRETVATGEAHYWSRSRDRLWRKGEESGHVQRVRSIHLDCDGDGILLKIEQVGGVACHTGRESCFFRRLAEEQWVETDSVLKDPARMYGNGREQT